MYFFFFKVYNCINKHIECPTMLNFLFFCFSPILVLPPARIEVVECEQTDHERDFYEALFRRSKVYLCFCIFIDTRWIICIFYFSINWCGPTTWNCRCQHVCCLTDVVPRKGFLFIFAKLNRIVLLHIFFVKFQWIKFLARVPPPGSIWQICSTRQCSEQLR